MNVSACLVTRGDVEMSPILDSLTAAGITDHVIWDNSKRENLAVYGRYAAIAEAKHDLIYVQDDDVIVSNPLEIVDVWYGRIDPHITLEFDGSHVVCNMPEAHRSQPFYKEHSLVGYGAVFHRDAPARAFTRFNGETFGDRPRFASLAEAHIGFFYRRCDVVFTALTPRVLVDVPIRNLPYYDAPNRSWKQKDHFKERKRMLELALQVRDA